MSKLTHKQQAFVREYLVDLNATKAAERAGYSVKTAKQQGARLLTNVDVSSAVQAEMDRRAVKTGITADRVLAEIAKCAFFNISDFLKIDPESGRAFIDLSKATPEQLAAVAGVEEEEWVERVGADRDSFEGIRKIKLKMSDKLSALEKLGKHLKLFTEKVEVEGSLKIEAEDVKQKLLAKLAGGKASSAA